MQFTKNIKRIFCAIIVTLAINNFCNGKSVYVFPSIGSSEVRAYKIDANSLVFQKGANALSYSSPVGIALCESDFGRELFCSFEGRNVVELINAQEFISDGTVTVPNSGNLAGLVFDKNKGKLYTVNRYQNRLWSYSWNPETKTLLADFNSPYYVILEGLETGSGKGSFGIALDEVP
jgi:hypothetical protein